MSHLDHEDHNDDLADLSDFTHGFGTRVYHPRRPLNFACPLPLGGFLVVYEDRYGDPCPVFVEAPTDPDVRSTYSGGYREWNEGHA